MSFFRKGKPSAATKAEKNRAKKQEELKVTVKIGRSCPNIRAEDVKREFIDTVTLRMSKREIAVINASGGIRVTVKQMGWENQAEYSGFRNGRHQIIIDPIAFDNPETITHEMIHILQEIDPKRPELDMILARDSRHSWEDITLREAMTEAEAIGRQDDPDLVNTPFYDDIEERCIKQGTACCRPAVDMKKDDHEKLTKGTGRGQGEKTIVYVHKELPNLEISQYQSDRSQCNARERLEQIRKSKISRTDRKK